MYLNIFPHAANIIHDNYSTCLSSFSSNIIGSRYLLIGIHNMRRKGKPRDAGVSLIAHSNASNISCIEVNKCIFRVFTCEKSSPQLLKHMNNKHSQRQVFHNLYIILNTTTLSVQDTVISFLLCCFTTTCIVASKSPTTDMPCTPGVGASRKTSSKRPIGSTFTWINVTCIILA